MDCAVGTNVMKTRESQDTRHKGVIFCMKKLSVIVLTT
uniref:Predicted protein n=1 Tax=Hordeum vulgare subsp. vulgare TaxID=112509 RepID=F2EHE5_HORVV|nr:predicted protein [Hordeum vulgare subsp. vulgare]